MPATAPIEQVARRSVSAWDGCGPSGSPKRSESSTATGRAPIAKMSRRMPADAGGRALEGLDGARVVVGLDLERAHEPVADVHGAGVLARAHDDVRALGRQAFAEPLGVLVGAVLAPQQRVHRELDLVRRAALLLADQLVLGARQPERERVLDAVGSVAAVRHAAPSHGQRIDSKILSPSVEPRQRVDRVLGVGHQAEHVAALVAHAGDVVQRAVEVLAGRVAQHHLAALPPARRASASPA